jgi:transposase
MMGRDDSGQEQFFYAFNLEDYVPEDHLLRGIDYCLDLSDLHRHLAPYYSHTGRPSIDPELMIRMLIIGYCFGIRSERQLCEEVQLNLAYRWFCRLSIEDKVPDHSTFSKNRHGRFRESDAFRYVFEQVLHRCMEEGLVGGEGFAVDASVVKADASRQRHFGDDDDWGDGGGSRAVREYLEALDESKPPEGKPAKKVSVTDPGASWTAAPGGPAFYGYSTNYLVDTESGIIVDVEASRVNHAQEAEVSKVMLERVEDRFEIKPKKLIGDMAYGSAAMLGWLVKDRGIEPHVPVWDKGTRSDGTFSRSDFTFDPSSDTYTCPDGKLLKRYRRAFKRKRSGIQKDNTINYRASQLDCRGCAMKARCCPNDLSRKVTRSIHEAARDVARRIGKTESYRQSRKDRKKVEMLFAHMKRILKLDRLRLRGLSGARDEFLLTATVQNLRRMARYLGTGPPRSLVSAVT